MKKNRHFIEPHRLPILSSLQAVVEHSRQVFFHPERLLPAVIEWGHQLAPHSTWWHPCHYFDGTQRTVQWIFVLDVLNHCFWPAPDEPAWSVAYRGETRSGYWGLAASLKRAMENGVPLTDAAYLEGLSADELRRIFLGEGEIPLFEERLCNLREAGHMLASRWQGQIVHLIEAAANSAVRAVCDVVTSFPSFRDQAQYRGNTAYFWKRAQLFIADLHLAFAGKTWGEFHDIGELTAFADYKLPQVLREFGVISYSPGLAERIDTMQELDARSEEEVEIRAMTVWAVEKLRSTFGEVGREVTSTQVDNWLWQLGQIPDFRNRPYHRCRTIYY